MGVRASGRPHAPRRARGDTATHPDFQRRGIFRNLTTTALDELAASGVDFIFNTPNDKSRPGYLQLGWEDVGRLATTVRPTGIGSAIRIARAHACRPTGGRCRPTRASPRPSSSRIRVSSASSTAPHRRPAGCARDAASTFLRWRYGFAELAYRAIVLDDDPARGLAIFRLRRRGSAVEAALCDLLVPSGPDAPDAARALERAVVHGSGADYVIRLDRRAGRADRIRAAPRPGSDARLARARADRDQARPRRMGTRPR